MICQQCKAKTASVHFKGLINNAVVKMDLCEGCAQQSGWSAPEGMFGSPLSISAFFPTSSPALSELLNSLAHWTKTSVVAAPSVACPHCRWTLGQLQKTARLGCSHCYQFFHQSIHDLVKQVHGSTQHKGKIPMKEETKPKARAKKDSVSDLKQKLEKAVKEEQYELAAQIRDQIKLLEKEEKA